MSHKMLRPWRAQGTNADRIDGSTPFDECVVGNWLHVEAMGPRHVWMRVGPLQINVSGGKVLRIRIDRGADDGEPYEVTVDGDLAVPAKVRAARHAVLLAYEGSRRTPQEAPDPVVLRARLEGLRGQIEAAR